MIRFFLKSLNLIKHQLVNVNEILRKNLKIKFKECVLVL